MAKVTILKAVREKQSADLSTETLQARREQQHIHIQSPEREKSITQNTLVNSIIIQIEAAIKNFSDKQKVEDYSNTKPIMKEILQGLPQIEKLY